MPLHTIVRTFRVHVIKAVMEWTHHTVQQLSPEDVQYQQKTMRLLTNNASNVDIAAKKL